MERHSSMSNIPDRTNRSGAGRQPLQRHATADLSFFTPSSTSFHPKPYIPSVVPVPIRTTRTSALSSLQHHESSSSAMLQQKSLDVSPDDLDAFFIRYPFTSFPDAHLYPEGLTFNVMTEQPDWFLDPADFRRENETDPNRIVYPQILEPPRGWCPMRKKDAKDKGPELYNGEDVPRLRCTFCRRTYAGVNAKSMWRRHVLEKHKIPMANRRDEGSGRGRSSSNKENRRSSSSAPTIKKDGFTIQTFFKPNMTEAASPSVPNSISENRASRNTDPEPRSPSPNRADEVGETETVEKLGEIVHIPAPTKPTEPEIVPDDDARSCSSHRSPQLSRVLPPSSPLEEGASHLSWLDLSSSPMRTPNLHKKRSHLRMPWKFPSPSHPLYSGPDELCLGVPIGGMTGEGLRSSYVALQASPFPGTAGNQLQFSSPVAASPLSQKPVTGRVLGWKRPKNRTKSKLPPLPDPSPRRPLYTGPLPVPLSDGLQLSPPPDLTMSTDSDIDNSFSSLGEPFSTDAFSKWFDMSSPKKGEKDDTLLTGLPDTPLRRSTSSSAIDKLQLVSPEKETEKDEESASTLLPSGFGLGLNFKINLATSGSKRARSEGLSDHDSEDEFGELLCPKEDPVKAAQPAPGKKSGHKPGNSSISSISTNSTEHEVAHTSTDVDSEDLEFVFGDSIPLKKRRLLT